MRMLLAAASLFSLASFALAAEPDYPPVAEPESPAVAPESGLAAVTGNVHAGTRHLIGTGGDETTWIQELRLGTKIAYEPADSDFGIQADLEYGGVPFSLISPDVGADGAIHDMLGIAHLTYAYDSFTKFGLYGGYERLQINIDGIDGDAGGLITVDPGTIEAEIASDMWHGGVEALFALDETSWVQVRAGIVDPFKVSATADLGSGPISGSASDDDNDLMGWQVGFGYRTGLTANWSMRTDVNYTNMMVTDGPDTDILNLLVTSQYTFDTMPLALTASAGYITGLDDTDNDSVVARTNLIWSFGERGQEGVRGKLFKSANFQGDVN